MSRRAAALTSPTSFAVLIVLTVLTVLTARPDVAHAFDSRCLLFDGSECAAGPQTAHNRWRSAAGEHRLLWNATAEMVGLPNKLRGEVSVSVFTGSDEVVTAQGRFPSLRPVAFEAATQIRVRAWEIGELAQLPDFSYSFADWAAGNDLCRLPGGDLDPEACHTFASHMGPVNSNHFLPQAATAYARLHDVALARARRCKRMHDLLSNAETIGMIDYSEECEIEALSLEAMAQHFLQDAWSEGHMWERWGSPDVSDFEPLPAASFTTPISDPESARYRATVIAAVSGLIHGAKAVVEPFVESRGWRIDDALCAPSDDIAFVDAAGTSHAGLGDLFASAILDARGNTSTPFREQATGLYSCAIQGLTEVYQASGEQHGAARPGALPPGLRSVDVRGAACFGQRATNRAMARALGLDFYVPSSSPTQVTPELAAYLHAEGVPDANGVQWHMPLVLLVSRVLPDLFHNARTNEVLFQLQLDLVRMIALTELKAAADPEGTTLASGGLGPLLGMAPNSQFVTRRASYEDPSLPWPVTHDTTQSGLADAAVLSRMFHRAHADDLCSTVPATTLLELSNRVQRARQNDPALVETACKVCTEIVQRHLRRGSGPADYDAGNEPLCYYINANSEFVYSRDGGEGPAGVAAAFCGCSPTCAASETECGTSCCGGLDTCRNGSCQCPEHLSGACGEGTCVDVETDSANCGECGNDCGSGQHCEVGFCVLNPSVQPPPCMPACNREDGKYCSHGTCCTYQLDLHGRLTEEDCNGDGTCENVATGNDPMNCGYCGQVCPADRPLCSFGQCVCATGRGACSGATRGQPAGCCAIGEDCRYYASYNAECCPPRLASCPTRAGSTCCAEGQICVLHRDPTNPAIYGTCELPMP